MNLLIAADHAGLDLKEKIKARASDLGVTFTDLGTHTAESVDYPDYAKQLSLKLIELGANSNLGILICGSGVGVSIAANRYPEIRAVLAESPEVATLAREHNHANVLCLGSRILSAEKAVATVKAFLGAREDQGPRHLNRIKKLGEMKS